VYKETQRPTTRRLRSMSSALVSRSMSMLMADLGNWHQWEGLAFPLPGHY
jgi:hypothetical protein